MPEETAVLVLEDGTTLRGAAFGAEGETFGEMVFNTGMTGYQETLTDPSYCRQIVAMTAPHIGNTGVNDEDPESGQVWVSGYVVREPARLASSWRATGDLDAYLRAEGVTGIAVRGFGEDLSGGRGGGHHDHLAAPGRELARGGGLDAQVDGDDAVPGGPVRRDRVRLGRAHHPGQVGAGHLRAGQHPLEEPFRAGLHGADRRSHGTLLADPPGQQPGLSLIHISEPTRPY